MPDQTSLNQQVVDSVAEAAKAVLDAAGPQSRAVASQVTVLAVSLAMQNAVAQQQQLYMLQNAATTAVVRALLAAGPEQAARWQELLSVIRELFAPAGVEETLGRLKRLLDEMDGAPPVPGRA